MSSGLQGIGHIPYSRDEYWKSVSEFLGYEAPTKTDVWRLMGYRPLRHAIPMHLSRATHRIVAGGNRSGKTYSASAEAVPYLLWENTRGWVVSSNYDMADQLRLEVMGFLMDGLGIEHAKGKKLDVGMLSWSNYEHALRMWNGSLLELKSAEAPDSMNAVPVDYIIIDEAALFPFLYYDTRIIPRLVDSGGWVLAIGTFEFLQGEWFEEYFDLGQVPDNSLGIESFMLPTTDNFHVYIAQGGETPEYLGKRYRTNWRKIVENNPGVGWPLAPGMQVIIYNVDMAWLEQERKRIDPRTFAARYLALSQGNQFRVFPSYQIHTHVREDIAEYDPDLPVFLAIDPGGTYGVLAIQFKKATSLGLPAENELSKGDICCAIDEVYIQTTTTTQEIWDIIKKREWFSRLYHHPWEDRYQGAIDVMVPEIQRTWERCAKEDIEGFHLLRKKVNIVPGILTLQHWLDTNSLYVHPRCRWFSTEMRRYQYTDLSPSQMESRDPRGKDKPRDEWNHLIKALTYLLVIRYGYWGKSDKPVMVSRTEAIKTKRLRRRERLDEYARRVIHG
jgi:hypothetical protein